MADTTTTNLSLTKPEVGASADTWGGKLNTNLDTIDGVFAAAGNGTSVGLNVGSGKTLTVGGTQTMSALTASTALALNSSKNIVSVTNTGTGNNVLSASPTLTGTIDAAAQTLSGNLTLSGGTANGVLYLNASKVATSGSALTFDGTTLTATRGIAVNSTGTATSGFYNGVTISGYDALGWTGTSTLALGGYRAGQWTEIGFYTGGSSKALLDSSGNLGLGVTPSAWTSGKAFEVGSAGHGVWASSGYTDLMQNVIYSTDYKYAATGTATRYDMSSGAHAWYSAASGTAGTTVSFGSAKMTLDASGRLGVGATSLTANFTVADATRAIAYIQDTAGRILRFQSPTSSLGATIGTSTNHDLGLEAGSSGVGANVMTFSTAGSERARITAGGDLLVATTNAAENAGPGMKVLNTGGTVALVSTVSDSSQQGFEMYSTGAAAYRLYVNYAGTIHATNTTISAISDQRYKENIRDLDAGLDAILALKPRKFDWKEGKGKDIKDDRGFIAQEFEQVFPDLIDEWRDPAPEGEEPYKSVRQDLIPVLVKAIQELKAELDATKAKVAALESK
jgi:fibronectin-binding autotransporter adhesin